MPVVQIQVGDVQRLVHRKEGCRGCCVAWQTSFSWIFENVSSWKVHYFFFFLNFIFIPPSPGSLSRTLTDTIGVSCQGKTGPEVRKKKKKGKTGGGKNNNRRKSEDRLQQRNGGQFVRARITSSATRNQTAGSLRTWLSGFLQEGGKKKKRRWSCHRPLQMS